MNRMLSIMLMLAGMGPAAIPAQAGEAGRGATGAKAEVIAAFDRLGTARSYRAEVEDRGAGNGPMRIEHVAPDRFRIQMDDAIQTIIGNEMHVQVEGQTHRLPVPPGSIDGIVGQWRHAARMTALPSTRVESQGRERIDGVDAVRFRITNGETDNGSATVWIADGYPRRIVIVGDSDEEVIFRYTDLNSTAIRIEPPR